MFAYGGIFKGGGPIVLTFLLFYIIFMLTIMNGDGNFVCVLFRIFISKNKGNKNITDKLKNDTCNAYE